MTETDTVEPTTSTPASTNPSFDWPVIDPSEDPAGVERDELEEKYLDLKDEVWRLRRTLNLDPSTGAMPTNGGYAAQGGFLRRQSVAVFVDVQNMYHSAKKTFGTNLSYAKMLRACVRNRRLVRAQAYVIEREGMEQNAFTDHLHYCGFEVSRRPVIERADGTRKAEWELAMSMDMMAMADKVESIIIVSGNGMFADVIPALKAKGVKVEACAFRESMSDTLRNAVDWYHLLGEEHLHEDVEKD
jgi:uncharacterized LabA/DUF88 family protein